MRITTERDTMPTRRQCALGVSVHAGWVACVVARGSVHARQISAREEVELLGDLERFVYHRAAEARVTEERILANARRSATARATAGLGLIVDQARARGEDITACAIVAKGGELLALDAIRAAHPRIHSAEGHFYRDVLHDAAEGIGLATRILSPRDPDAHAARAMDVGLTELPALLALAGRAVGRPWAKDQKAASLAAWTVLAEGDGRTSHAIGRRDATTATERRR
jgi:hypothetical protein